MLLKDLTFFNFRNLADQKIELVSGINFLCGKNGQGKTNVAEAISILSHTKSFRTQHSEELIRWGADQCSVFGTAQRQVGSNIDEFKLGVAIERKKRSLFLDEQRVASAAEYVGQLKVVSFSPSDLSLVKGAPQGRRSFVDKHMLYYEPRVFESLVAYQRALKSKRAIIVEVYEKRVDRAEIARNIAPWNQILAEEAASIVSARKRFVSEIQRRAREIYSKFGAEDLAIRYESTFDKSLGVEITKERIFELYQALLEKEIMRGGTFLGPHRDDVALELSGQDARAFASQGQTRSLVLAIKLALRHLIFEQSAEFPVVVLDDVDSELDETRRAALFEVIFAHGTQVVITGTEVKAALGVVPNLTKFEVENGVVRPSN